MFALSDGRCYSHPMGKRARLHATLALAYYSLMPPAPDRMPTFDTCGSPPPYTIKAEEIAAAIAHMNSFAGSDGMLAILFIDALALSAPFLLFRMKRTGFSSCRAMRVPEGLLVTARR